MPRATWRGHLRLSLVSCPVYLTPATTRVKPIRLHQVWVPSAEPRRQAHNDDEVEPDTGESWADLPEPAPAAAMPAPASADVSRLLDRQDEPQEVEPAPTRIALRPHDPRTGAEIERDEVVKGYEYERGHFVTLTKDELKALDVESSKVIDLGLFVPRSEVDPVYFDTSYYLYPDGPVAVEAFRVIAAALAEAGMAGIGRLTLSRRERMVMVEPRGGGMVLMTLRAAEEVRAAGFDAIADRAEGDAEMVEIATAIIERRAGHFDPSTFHDRYQEALRDLIEAKAKGRTVKPVAVAAPAPEADLMAALKRSLAEVSQPEQSTARPAKSPPAKAKQKSRAKPDARQRAMLLPLAGKGRTPAKTAAKPGAKPGLKPLAKPAAATVAETPARRRRNA